MAGPYSRDSDSAGLGWALISCTSNKVPSATAATTGLRGCTLRTTDLLKDQVQTLHLGIQGSPQHRLLWLPSSFTTCCPKPSPPWSQHATPFPPAHHGPCWFSCLKHSVCLDPPSSRATVLDFTMSKTQIFKNDKMAPLRVYKVTNTGYRGKYKRGGWEMILTKTAALDKKVPA